jgi:hypothetical protein
MPKEDENVHPCHWGVDRLAAWSKGTDVEITIESGLDEIKLARNRAANEFLNRMRMDKKAAMERVRERVRMHYESGASMKMICDTYKVKRALVERWAEKEKWKLPPAREPDKPMTPSARAYDQDAIAEDVQTGIVTHQSEARLPLAVRELNEQKRLMNIRGAQWDEIPHEKVALALRMRLTRQARRMIEKMETLDEDEIIAPEMMKTFKTIAEVLDKVAPIPEDKAVRTNSLLHVTLFKDDGLPKKAQAIEIPA